MAPMHKPASTLAKAAVEAMVATGVQRIIVVSASVPQGSDLLCAVQYRLDAAVGVGVRGVPSRHADAHRDLLVPGGGPAPAGAVGLDGGDQAVGGLIAAGADQDLVEDHVVEDVQAGLAQRVADPAGLPACGGDQVCYASAAKAAQHRPHLDLAGTLRGLRRVMHRLETVLRREIVADGGETAAEVFGVAKKDDPAVIGDVEPLVRIGGPGVGIGHAAHEVSAGGVGQRPQAEGTIDV